MLQPSLIKGKLGVLYDVGKLALYPEFLCADCVPHHLNSLINDIFNRASGIQRREVVVEKCSLIENVSHTEVKELTRELDRLVLFNLPLVNQVIHKLL